MAMRAMVDSSTTPGPLGMDETSPKADAPCAMASRASSGDLMQQIFTRSRIECGGSVENFPTHGKRALHHERETLKEKLKPYLQTGEWTE